MKFYNIFDEISKRENDITFIDHILPLFDLQNDVNLSGVTCVRSICHYLERGDIGSALTVLYTQWDKIRQYPRLVEYFKKNDFVPEDYV